jgi:oligoribonuclease (3'-5' exoribonuclease)
MADMSKEELIESIKNTRNVKELGGAINKLYASMRVTGYDSFIAFLGDNGINKQTLKKFGGRTPYNHDMLWSWDKDRVLKDSEPEAAEIVTLVKRPTFYLWFDLEYSELDLDSAAVLQVGLAVTDQDLQPVIPPPSTDSAWRGYYKDQDPPIGLRIPVKPEIEFIPQPWLIENQPSLLEESKNAKHNEKDVDEIAIKYLEALLPGEQIYVLAGNSVHNDWYLSRKYFPGLVKLLSYRLLDVTAFKLEWKKHGGKKFDKENAGIVDGSLQELGRKLVGSHEKHDAFFDVQASLAELAFYRRSLWPNGNSSNSNRRESNLTGA